MNASEKCARISEVVETIPGALDVLFEHAMRMRSRTRGARRSYSSTHWGERGDFSERGTTIPDTSTGVVTVMGELVEVAYLTAKGSRRVDQWEHGFSSPYPLLCFAKDGARRGLVIARGRSRYTVTARGIEG